MASNCVAIGAVSPTATMRFTNPRRDRLPFFTRPIIWRRSSSIIFILQAALGAAPGATEAAAHAPVDPSASLDSLRSEHNHTSQTCIARTREDSVTLPPWVVLHVPHDATFVPASVREQFVVSEQQLAAEIERWTDHHTVDLWEATEGPNS